MFLLDCCTCCSFLGVILGLQSYVCYFISAILDTLYNSILAKCRQVCKITFLLFCSPLKKRVSCEEALLLPYQYILDQSDPIPTMWTEWCDSVAFCKSVAISIEGKVRRRFRMATNSLVYMLSCTLKSFLPSLSNSQHLGCGILLITEHWCNIQSYINKTFQFD